MSTILLLLGLVLLTVGGDLLVRGAVSIARHMKVSPLVIGLTLVGFGTSVPELVTSLDAAFVGSPAIAVGNVVGSNTANILLILGLSAWIRPLATPPGLLRRDGVVFCSAALACCGVVLVGTLGRPVGVALVGILVAYVAWSYRTAGAEGRAAADGAAVEVAAAVEAETPVPEAGRWGLALLASLGGLALTIVGARLLVTSALELGRFWGVPEVVMGVTVVAIGTSLPELVTSLTAALRRQSEIALGNVIGSNIFNVYGLLGTTAIVVPVPVPREIVVFDVWVMLAATLMLMILAATGRRIGRAEGATLVVAYAAYLTLLASGGIGGP